MTNFKKILPLAAILAVAVPGQAFAGGPKPKLQFSASTYAVAENAGQATITVQRPGNTKRTSMTASVTFSTADGTAKAGVDYTATTQTVTFAPSVTSQTVNVPIIDNSNVDGPRTVNLKLSNPTASGRSALLGYPSTATLVISDDETNTGGGGGTPSGGSFQLASATDTISEAAGVEKVFVVRSGDLSQSAKIDYATAPGTAVDGVDYTGVSGELTFPDQATDATKSVIQEVDVPILHNSGDTTATKTFMFNLALPSPNSTNSTLGSPSSKTVTIVNVDGTPTIQWASPGYSVSENGGSVRLTAFLSGSVPANGEVDVDYATQDGSAVQGVNYTAASDVLQFMPGDVAESVDVAVNADGQQGDKYFTAGLAMDASSPNAGTIGDPAATTVTVVNTDPAPSSGSGDTGSNGGTTVVNNETTNVTNTTVTPQGDQLVLGARQAACGLTAKAAKKQRLLKQKVLKLTLKTGQACKATVTAMIKQVKARKKHSAKSARVLSFKGKKATLALQPGKAKTVKVKFTKRTLKAINKALRAHKKLVATVVVTTRDSASKVTRKTLKITIRR